MGLHWLFIALLLTQLLWSIWLLGDFAKKRIKRRWQLSEIQTVLEDAGEHVEIELNNIEDNSQESLLKGIRIAIDTVKAMKKEG